VNGLLRLAFHSKKNPIAFVAAVVCRCWAIAGGCPTPVSSFSLLTGYNSASKHNKFLFKTTILKINNGNGWKQAFCIGWSDVSDVKTKRRGWLLLWHSLIEFTLVGVCDICWISLLLAINFGPYLKGRMSRIQDSSTTSSLLSLHHFPSNCIIKNPQTYSPAQMSLMHVIVCY